jgi:hypothetical protein
VEIKPTLPYSTWRFPEPWVTVPLTAAILGATLGYPAAKLIFEHPLREPSDELFVAATTAFLSALVAAFQPRPSTPGSLVSLSVALPSQPRFRSSSRASSAFSERLRSPSHSAVSTR